MKNKETPEEQLLKFQHNIGIKVQSVALPVKNQLHFIKTEEQIINWLQNKVQNVHTVFYQYNNKYQDCEN